MDRSPTPERPRRAAPKRLRVAASDAPGKGNEREGSDKENKRPSSEVDVGVLLGESVGPISLYSSFSFLHSFSFTTATILTSATHGSHSGKTRPQTNRPISSPPADIRDCPASLVGCVQEPS